MKSVTAYISNKFRQKKKTKFGQLYFIYPHTILNAHLKSHSTAKVHFLTFFSLENETANRIRFTKIKLISKLKT